MKTKIVYSIVSNESDHYLEQLMVSLHSLRKHNPDACVEIVCDIDTYNSFAGWREKIKDYNVVIIPVDVSQYPNNMYKSRFLKTSLRQIIKGDFLFVDTDTIITSDLSKIDRIKTEMGGVTDYNLEKIPNGQFDICLRAGFPELKNVVYFNSGIIYVKDTEHTHKFYENWNRLWRETLAKGIPFDQSSYNKTIQSGVASFSRLDNRWNYQINGSVYVDKPYIVHYFGSENTKLIDKFYETLRGNHSDKDLDTLTSIILCAKRINNSKQFDKLMLSSLSWAATNAYSIYYKLSRVDNLLLKTHIKFHKIISKILRKNC